MKIRSFVPAALLGWARGAVARALATFVVTMIAAAACSRAAEPPREEPKPAWRNGPVRYLIMQDEDKAFKALKTDEERAQAIEQFWSRRDPTSGTPANELRQDFLERIEKANARFREGTGAGWTTDRGRVLLVAGEPDSRSGEGDERESWIYARPVPTKSGASAKGTGSVKVVFARNESGEYRIEPEGAELLARLREADPVEAARFAVPGAKTPAGAAPRPAAAAVAAPTPASPPGAAAAPPAAEVLPPEIDRLRQASVAGEVKDELALETSARFFKAEDGSTRTVIMIGVKKAQLAVLAEGKPGALLFARLTPTETPDAKPVDFWQQELFTLYDDEKEGWMKYAFAWPLKKRSYELRVAVSDGPAGKLAAKTVTLSLPDFKNEALSLSSVTLARHALQAGSDPSVSDPFTLGSLKLIPWISPTLGPGDDFSFFYDVYNAKRDPATNQPSLDVTYVFEIKDAGAWKRKARVAEADKHEERLGYSIPAAGLAPFPAGDWRVTIQVKDKIAAAEASSSVEFALRK